MEDKVLETIVNGLEYDFFKDILVKPLEPIMIDKEVAVGTGEEDVDGFEKMKTEVKSVQSDFLLGIVLAIPENRLVGEYPIQFKVGDTVVFPTRSVKPFDLFKTSLLVKEYDIVGKKK